MNPLHIPATASSPEVDFRFDAHELLTEAMAWFEQAEAAHPEHNEDAVLRWNTCARLIMNKKLEARPLSDDSAVMSE